MHVISTRLASACPNLPLPAPHRVYMYLRGHPRVARIYKVDRYALAKKQMVMALCSYKTVLNMHVFITALSVVLVAVQAQDCPLLVTPDELGNTTALSQEGLIASSYLVGDASTAPFVQILEARRVCLAAGSAPARYRWVSVIVRYICNGAVPAIAPAPCGNNLEVTSQIDFGCVDTDGPTGANPPEWAIGLPPLPNILTYVSIPPDGDFTTPLQISCSFCVNPTEGPAAGFGDVDTESHCAGQCNA